MILARSTLPLRTILLLAVGGALAVAVGVVRPTVAGRPGSGPAGDVRRSAANASSTIAVDDARRRVWTVNPDNGSVAALATADDKLAPAFGALEVPVGNEPRTVAVAPDGSIWVTVRGDGVVRVVDPREGKVVETVRFHPGSKPFGVAFSPDRSAAYVTLEGTGEVAKADVGTRKVIAKAAVCPSPRHLAVTADGRVLVGRFVSPEEHGEVVEVDAGDLRTIRTIKLATDPGPDTPLTGRGVPNYLGAMAVSPDGGRLWVPSKKDNTARGLARDGKPLTFENTVRTMSAQVDLAASAEVLPARLDHNDADMACAAVYAPAGDRVFVAFQGSNKVEVIDPASGRVVTTIAETGLAPQGVALSADGRRLYVQGVTSRTVSVYDVGAAGTAPLLAERRTVERERLSADVLRGKQIFHNAADPRMSRDSYISCATCHADGGQDGRVWDFTDRGEGLRNTQALVSHKGTNGTGALHWSGNFDEVQDFEQDIRGPFGGKGFLHDDRGNDLMAAGTRAHPFGDRKAGLSKDLDALAAFVGSLDRVGVSPHRDADGSLTADAKAGRRLFFSDAVKCAWCHMGPGFTDSARDGRLHDVGAIKSTSGHRLGKDLYGMDTPSLRGAWATAPYFHDGSAATLLDVLNVDGDRHGDVAGLTDEQKRLIAAYVSQIDDLETGGVPYTRTPKGQDDGPAVDVPSSY